MIQRVNRSIPNPIPCVLDILEVLVEDTEQPRFLPWEFDTLTMIKYDLIVRFGCSWKTFAINKINSCVYTECFS